MIRETFAERAGLMTSTYTGRIKKALRCITKDHPRSRKSCAVGAARTRPHGLLFLADGERETAR